MDLHRTSGKPDWADIPLAKRNVWQRLAANSRGIVTPGNVITIIGYILVLFGLKAIAEYQLLLGGILLAIGRLLDIADGAAADATGTKSPTGELLDATIDKVGTALTILIFYMVGAAPWWILTALLIPQLIIAYVSLRGAGTDRQLHPSKVGKFSMLAAWFTLLGFVFAGAAGNPPFAIIPVYMLAVISIGLGFKAAADYSRGKY